MIIAKIIIECVYEQKITKDKFKYHITWKKMTCTDAWPPAHRSVKHCVTTYIAKFAPLLKHPILFKTEHLYFRQTTSNIPQFT